MDDRDSVVGVIKSAFRGVVRGRMTLHEAEASAFYATPAVQLSARERDRESRWEEVPDSSIEECAAALTFLDPVSWLYYLPAYMLWFIDSSRGKYGCMAADSLIYELCLRPPEAELSVGRFRMLDHGQGKAVLAFLRLVSEDKSYGFSREAAKAIDCYWIKYL